MGVLPTTEHVEIAQAYVFEPFVGAGEHVGIKFIHIFGYRIRRKRFADHILHFGKTLRIAVGRRRGRKYEPAHSGVAGGNEHVQKAADVDFVRGDGVLDRTGNRSQSRFMQYVFDPVHGLTAILKLADVADDQFETVGIAFDQRNEIFHVPCGEIVQANHLVAPLQQCFAQVGADETGSAGN